MNHPFDNDAFLIQELKAGNSDAYRFLFDTYYNAICVYINSFTKNKDQTEDIVQDTFLKLWLHRKRLKIHTSVKAYLYKASYNTFVNTAVRVQREKRILEEMEKTALNEIVHKEDTLIEDQLRLIQQEIEKLPPKCREVLILSKQKGMKYKEIASQLNISVKTVEAHLRNALLKIKKRLTDREDQ